VVRSLCGLGKTIFLTTHYMDEAQFLADRVAVMNHGEIIASGRSDELGGRDLRPAEIRFRLPNGLSLVDLPKVPGEPSMDGDSAVVLTYEPVLASQRITTWAVDWGIQLAHFSVTQPTLEDIYLELTGSSPEAQVPGRPEHETDLEVAA
jgi:ABC-2 type transport system ATP-binding protein